MADGHTRRLYINFCQPVLPITLRGGVSACEPVAGACATELVDGQVNICHALLYL